MPLRVLQVVACNCRATRVQRCRPGHVEARRAPRSGCDCRRYWCQRLLGRVGDVDGHRDGVVRRTVTRLDPHRIARIRLVVIGLTDLGLNLPGPGIDGELVLVRALPAYSSVCRCPDPLP